MDTHTAQIRHDFDQLARLPEEPWNHNSHYHPFLIQQLPPRCRRALDVGCGIGCFTRKLARRADEVLALDLSPAMIEAARARAGDLNNIYFEVSDVRAWPFAAETFDCIASIATLHHLPAEQLEQTLAKMRRALQPGGVLLLLDLLRVSSPGDLARGALAKPLSVLLRWHKTGRLRQSPEARRLWAAHGLNDEKYLSLREVHGLYGDLLPGAQIRQHLFWRYSVVWRKPL